MWRRLWTTLVAGRAAVATPAVVPEDDGPRPRLAIACNYLEATRAVPLGAAAYVAGPIDGYGRAQCEVVVRSRSGRWIAKREPLWRLGLFRTKSIHPTHNRYGDFRIWTDFRPGTAEYMADLGTGERRRRGLPVPTAEDLRRQRRPTPPGTVEPSDAES